MALVVTASSGALTRRVTLLKMDTPRPVPASGMLPVGQQQSTVSCILVSSWLSQHPSETAAYVCLMQKLRCKLADMPTTAVPTHHSSRAAGHSPRRPTKAVSTRDARGSAARVANICSRGLPWQHQKGGGGEGDIMACTL